MVRQVFLDHQLKSFVRNNKWKRNVISKLLSIILAFFLILFFLLFGYNIDIVLTEFGHDPVETFNSILIFYILVDLILRFFFQSIPSAYFTPYLRFKLRHTELVNFMIIRSLWGFFNIIPWSIILPFIIKCVLINLGFKVAVFYMLAFLLLILINNFLAIIIQFLTRRRKIYYILPISLLLILLMIPKLVTSLVNLSIALGMKIVELNVGAFSVILLILLFVIFLLRKLLLSGFYFDENNLVAQVETLQKPSFIWDNISNFGIVGKYVVLELRLLLRNRRPKQTIIIYPVFPIYLLVLLFKRGQDESLTIIMLTFTFGLLSILYGQYIFSWESSFFDSIMTKKIDLFAYIKAKYYLMISLSFLLLIILIPIFIYFFKELLLSLFSMFIYSIGATNFIILFSGIFNDGRISLNESFIFNYQGFSINQLILPLLVLAIPIGVSASFVLFNWFQIGNILLLGIGLGFILSHNYWIKNILMKIFLKRKYKNLEGYRKLIS